MGHYIQIVSVSARDSLDKEIIMPELKMYPLVSVIDLSKEVRVINTQIELKDEFDSCNFNASTSKEEIQSQSPLPLKPKIAWSNECESFSKQEKGEPIQILQNGFVDETCRKRKVRSFLFSCF